MIMRAEYDFSDARKNPYAKILKRQITINIDNNTIDYFKAQSEQVGIPRRLSICICVIVPPTSGKFRFCGAVNRKKRVHKGESLYGYSKIKKDFTCKGV